MAAQNNQLHFHSWFSIFPFTFALDRSCFTCQPTQCAQQTETLSQSTKSCLPHTPAQCWLNTHQCELDATNQSKNNTKQNKTKQNKTKHDTSPLTPFVCLALPLRAVCCRGAPEGPDGRVCRREHRVERCFGPRLWNGNCLHPRDISLPSRKSCCRVLFCFVLFCFVLWCLCVYP